jgi:hypothetical protein
MSDAKGAGFAGFWNSPHVLPPTWVLTIVFLPKDGFDLLLAPYLFSCSPGVIEKGLVPFGEIRVYGGLAFLNTSLVAVVQYRARHSAKHGFDHVQKMSLSRQGHKLNKGRIMASSECITVVFIDNFVKRFRRMP